MSDKDPFYVGYLPLPQAIKRFIVPWLVGNIVLALGIAVVVAQQHREPGDGVWETGDAVTIEGELTVDPYPLLRSNGKTYILVEQGKLGVQRRLEAEGLYSGTVRARGFLIERNGRKVLELDSTEALPLQQLAIMPVRIEETIAVRPATADEVKLELEADLGTHTLRGEIVDPKCYLGVMQPGDGKTHKVCATLCIKGGIPPMLLVKNDQGETAAYLLTDAEGNAFPESHHEYIADPIEITGQVLRDGDLLILRADLASIKRLGVED